jgi:hypothetical protein
MTNRLLMPDGRLFYFLISTMPVPRPAAEIGNGGNYLKRHALMNYQENEPEKQRSGCDYYADYDSTIEAIRDELESGRQNAENSKPGNNEPVGILPPWIFCPGRNRSAVTPIQFENCAAESDLPERFIFGQLVPGSFRQLPIGFAARYASSHIDTVLSGDGVKLQFEVQIERSDPCYHVCHCSNTDWNPGLLYQLTATKSDLDKALKSVLESDFNIRYKCGELGKDLGEVCYVADGYAVSILIPFPMNDESCSDLGRFFDAIMNGPAIFCQAQLEQQVIVSNYRETKCPDLKLEPKELLVRDIDRGLIPYGIPEWEGEQGDRVLTIRRIGYVLVVQTYLHDLAGILEHLRACNIIDDGNASEQFAHIHDGHVAESLESCAGFSRDRSRRVVLGFTNQRPSSENRGLGNSRSSFVDQLQQTCERMQEIKRILIRRLARSASV